MSIDSNTTNNQTSEREREREAKLTKIWMKLNE